MQTFAFKYPAVLLNFLWIPLWLWLSLKVWHSHSYIFHSSLDFFKTKSVNPRKVPLCCRLFALICLILALARPQGIITHTQCSSGIDIILAIDLSSSMQIPDMAINQMQQTTRLDAAKAVVASFIAKRKYDRIGLIAFARYPYLVSPLTLNHPWLLKNLSRLNAGLLEDGTAIGSAITMGINRLKDLKAKTRLIILLTDGINNYGDVTPALAAEIARNFKTKIYTIMVGNDQFFPVDEKTLVQMAETTGGNFYRAADIHTLKGIYKEIDLLEKSKVKIKGFQEYTEIFPLCLYLCFSFLLLEFYFITGRYRILS